MKKTFCFCVAALILGGSGFMMMHLAAQQFVLDMQKEGSTIATDVAFTGSYLVGEHLVKFEMKNGAVSYDAVSDDVSVHQTYSPIFTLDKDMEAQATYHDPTFVSQDNENIAECEVKEVTKDQLSIKYEIPEIYYADGSFKTIETDLIDHSNEHIKLIGKITKCAQMKNTAIYQKEWLDDDSHGQYLQQNLEHKSYVRNDGEDRYYFMPPTTNSMTGNTAIYMFEYHPKINQEINITKLQTLKEDRIYEDLRMIDHKLLIISHDDANLYLDRYNIKGKKEKALQIAYREKDQTGHLLYQNDHYLLWNTGKQVLVIDTQAMQLVEKVAVPHENISDILYRNDTLYFMLMEGNATWCMQSFSHGQRQSQVNISLPADYQEDNEKNGIIDYGTFVR